MVAALPEHKITYTPVPRTASLRVKQVLARLDGAIPAKMAAEIARDTANIHRLYPTRRFRRGRITPRKDWFNFTVVRDPVDRLLSVYSQALFDSGEIQRSGYRRRGWAPLPSHPDPDYFFENLAEYREASKTVKHQTMPQVLFTGDDPGIYDKVYRDEAIDELSRDLSIRTAQVIRIPARPEAQARLHLQDLSPRAQSAVLSEIAPDLALYDRVIALRVA